MNSAKGPRLFPISSTRSHGRSLTPHAPPPLMHIVKTMKCPIPQKGTTPLQQQTGSSQYRKVHHYPDLDLRILYPPLRQSLHNPTVKLGSINSRKGNLFTQIFRQQLQQGAIPMAIQARGVEESSVFVIGFCGCVVGDGEFEMEGWLVRKLALIIVPKN